MKFDSKDMPTKPRRLVTQDRAFAKKFKVVLDLKIDTALTLNDVWYSDLEGGYATTPDQVIDDFVAGVNDEGLAYLLTELFYAEDPFANAKWTLEVIEDGQEA